MNTLEAIESRRSCKDFDSTKKVDEEIIRKVCEAGSKAASGMNKQAAKIIAITDKETRDLVSSKNAEILGASGSDPFYGAPCIICVVSDADVSTHVYDGALVMGNMMLAAEELGLGSCWIHRAKQFFEMPEGKALLQKAGIEGNYEGIGNLALGYPAGEKRPTPNYKSDYISYIN